MATATRPVASADPLRPGAPGGADRGVLPKVCPTCGHRYPGEFRLCPRDGKELDEVDVDREQDELIGSTLGGTYAIVRVIGEGGMGRVYEARHTRIRTKRFAIKVLHPEYARQPEVISRFAREAEAAAAIKSPFVVDVYDVDRSRDGRPYIACEYLEGTELAVYLEEVGRMPVGAAVRLTRQLCAALQSAHDQGVIHRDMKPENVFLTGDPALPVAKIIDFGISKFKDDARSSLTKTGMIMGTPSYMAPEQARGERVDHRADIYAVGAILYCMLTGQRPFDRGDPTATLTAVLTEDPQRPRVIESSIPEALEMIIQRAMAKSPGDRYESMDAFDTDLAVFVPRDAMPSDAVATAASTAASPARTAAYAAEGPTGVRREAAASLDRQVRESSRARPMIALYLLLGTLLIVGCVVTGIAALMRITRGDGPAQNLTGMEAALLCGFSVAAMATPVIVAIGHVRKEVWRSTIRAVAFAERLRRPIVAGLCAYGFAALFIRTIEGVLLRRSAGVAWLVWDVLLASSALIAAVFALAFLGPPKK